MRRQRRRDTKLEIEIRRALHALGYRFRVDYRAEPSLRARPDIVFTRKRVVVFVDGCFWHSCPQHATQPTNNADWWRDKLSANVARDRRTTDAFEGLGWRVVRIWEHEDIDDAVATIIGALDRSSHVASKN
jgi:DNA mismatch endonuclease (patch repair protein)